MLTVRSGRAAGRFVAASRKEKRKRFGPTACSDETMTG
jgi:hypothetical protein